MKSMIATTAMVMPEFLTDRDVAKILKVSPSTVRRLIYNGPDKCDRFDLRKAEPIVIGGMRRWDKARLIAAFGDFNQ